VKTYGAFRAYSKTIAVRYYVANSAAGSLSVPVERDWNFGILMELIIQNSQVLNEYRRNLYAFFCTRCIKLKRNGEVLFESACCISETTGRISIKFGIGVAYAEGCRVDSVLVCTGNECEL